MHVVMIGVVVFVFGILGILGILAKSLLADEIRSRLDELAGCLLRRAARHLGPKQQMIYDEVWLPDLARILHDAEGRPITRLWNGIRFAVGLLVSTRREARRSQLAVSEGKILEQRDLVQPEIAAIEASPPGPSGPEIISGDLAQLVPFFAAYNGGPVPAMSTGSGRRPAGSGRAAPTRIVRRWIIPSIVSASAAGSILVSSASAAFGRGTAAQIAAMGGPVYYHDPAGLSH